VNRVSMAASTPGVDLRLETIGRGRALPRARRLRGHAVLAVLHAGRIVVPVAVQQTSTGPRAPAVRTRLRGEVAVVAALAIVVTTARRSS
jgi:hypothetical protein